MGASSARPPDRRGVSISLPLVSVARLGRAHAEVAALGDLCARRGAGRRGMVDGRLRPGGARQRLAVPPRLPSDAGLRDLRGTDLDGTAAAAAKARRRAGAYWHHGGRFTLSGCGADLSWCAGGRARRRAYLQHLAADRRRFHSVCRPAVLRAAAVAEFFRESADGAVSASHVGLWLAAA